MKQQQPPPSAASNPSPPLPFAPSAVTTEQIQKYLDENKNLILAILENQTLGKLAESQQYQAVLQRNLMYLAAIADAQSPQNSTPPPSQMPPNPGAQQGNNSQKPQTPTPQQQQGGYPVGKMPFQLNTMQSQDHHHQQQQQQQQLMHMRSAQQQQQQQQQLMQGQPGLNMQQQQQQQFQGQSGPNSHQNMQHGGHHSNVGSFMGGGYNIVEANNSSEGGGQGK